MTRRDQQQLLVAELGRAALTGATVPQLVADAVAAVAEGLSAVQVALFERRGASLVATATHGWQIGERLAVDADSPIARAFREGDSTITETMAVAPVRGERDVMIGVLRRRLGRAGRAGRRRLSPQRREPRRSRDGPRQGGGAPRIPRRGRPRARREPRLRRDPRHARRPHRPAARRLVHRRSRRGGRDDAPRCGSRRRPGEAARARHAASRVSAGRRLGTTGRAGARAPRDRALPGVHARVVARDYARRTSLRTDVAARPALGDGSAADRSGAHARRAHVRVVGVRAHVRGAGHPAR